MSYTYPIDAPAMFTDRTHQFVGFGLPAADIDRVRAATTDFWADGPGGWPHEFLRPRRRVRGRRAPSPGLARLRLREVGTDGSHSTVRAQIGQQLAGSVKGERFLLGDVTADHDLARDRMHSFFGGRGPLLIFPMLGRRVRIVTQIADGDAASVERLQRLVDAQISGFRVIAAR